MQGWSGEGRGCGRAASPSSTPFTLDREVTRNFLPISVEAMVELPVPPPPIHKPHYPRYPLVAPSVYLVTATPDTSCLASSCHTAGKADFQDRWLKLKFQTKPSANTVVSHCFPEVEKRAEKKTWRATEKEGEGRGGDKKGEPQENIRIVLALPWFTVYGRIHTRKVFCFLAKVRPPET